jgi:hypothetical protein
MASSGNDDMLPPVMAHIGHRSGLTAIGKPRLPHCRAVIESKAQICWSVVAPMKMSPLRMTTVPPIFGDAVGIGGSSLHPKRRV